MNPISIGAAIAGIGVILGAFGTHALRGKIGYDLFEIYKTGCEYLMLHAFALIFYGLSKATAKWPVWCFLSGIVIFTGIRGFGAITPIGGVLFIAGWAGFAWQTRNTGLTTKPIKPISQKSE
jgi:uncharacterized membrane protein YgdD (TMEM256/DUF423 family)